MTHRSNLLSRGIKLIGIGFLIWILLNIETESVVLAYKSVSVKHIIIAIGIIPSIYIIKAWRWHILLINKKILLPFQETFFLYVASMFLGFVTPGRAGEAVRIPALIARGASMQTGITVTILDRLIDMVFLGFFSIGAIFIIFSWKIAIVLFVIEIIIIAFAKIIFEKLKINWCSYVSDMYVFTQIILATFLAWTIYFLLMFVLRDAFSIAVPAITFISIMLLVGILSIIPIAPAGLGTRDAALLYFLLPHFIPAEQIIAFSLSIFLLTLLVSTVIGGYCLRKIALFNHEKLKLYKSGKRNKGKN